MSGISGCGGGSQASLVQQLLQQLYQKTDANGNGSVSLSEFLSATGATGAGGLTPASGSSDPSTQLFNKLDTNGDGSLSQSEFMAPFQMFNSQSQASLLNAQEQSGAQDASSGTSIRDTLRLLMTSSATPASASGNTTDPLQQFAQDLISKVDANGDGSITKAELEQAVTGAGGTTQAADALWAKLDPNNTGSVNAQQVAQNLPRHHHHHHHGGGMGGMDPAQMFQQLDANGDGSISQSEFTAAVGQYQAQSGIGSGISDISALSLTT